MKLKAKVDPTHHIVVLSLDDAHPDFPNPDQISDGALRNGYSLYTTKNTPVLKECRESCFCVLAHGSPTELVGIDQGESLMQIFNYYQAHGKGRQLLLLSCLVGLQLARKLVTMLRVDVIAPTGVAGIADDGQVWCVPRPAGTPGADDRPNSALNWVRLKPTGEIIMLGSERLTAEFVKPK